MSERPFVSQPPGTACQPNRIAKGNERELSQQYHDSNYSATSPLWQRRHLRRLRSDAQAKTAQSPPEILLQRLPPDRQESEKMGLPEPDTGGDTISSKSANDYRSLQGRK
jgi:hypothetical protein